MRARRGSLALVRLLLGLVLVAGIAWGSLALWFDGSTARGLAGLLAAGFALGSLAVLVRLRPFWRASLIVLLALGIIAGWWLFIPASNDRDWYPDVARLPRATLEGSRLTLQNVRHFDYRSETDYTERWETRTFDLDGLKGVDLFLSFWGPTLIAHTIVSWEFADGSHLAISIEARKAQGQSYSAVRGFFRQFGLYYVVADERDLIRLRTHYRGERVYLYRTTMPAAQARALLLAYLTDVNRLAEHPRWYNALTHNCTTTIRYHLQHVTPGRPWDWRIFANGYLDELAYERRAIATELPFAELRARSDITERAKAADRDPRFSQRIREGLPCPREAGC
jgi:hypothetical protein